MKRYQTWVAALCLVAAAGCQSAPGLLNPGPAEYQQHVSNQFDPYPSVEDGPPVVGGRPIDYQQPYSEVRRSQPGRWVNSRFNPRNWFAQ
jgi:hypothetical protein